MDTVITVYGRLAREFCPMRVHMSCTTTLHVAVKIEHACRARHHYMHFTSPRFAVGIRIPQRRVVLEVGFSRPCGKAFNLFAEDAKAHCTTKTLKPWHQKLFGEIIESEK